MPMTFAETTDGLLFAANGVDKMLKWDGIDPEADAAGVIAPENAPTFTATGAGSITGTYYAYQRFIDVDENPSNLSPVTVANALSAKATITYSNLDAPTEAKVSRRQILRNTAGQTRTFYVDVDTEDLYATTATSTRTDSQLRLQDPVPLLDTYSRDLAIVRYSLPPNDKPFIANHQGRMFAAGNVDYKQGSVICTFGSKTVTGIGTEWTATMANRFLYIVGGGDAGYEIDSVDVAAQTLTLLNIYQGTTDEFAVYVIIPAPGRRKGIDFSEAGLPEAWPPTNTLSVVADGDDITGLMSLGSFLYVLEKRHIYRLTYQEDPAGDGFIFYAAGRGAINNRCWVVVEKTAYMLDELGIHAFGQTQESSPIGSPIQKLFQTGDSNFRVNWGAAKWFFATQYPAQETIRWFVTMSGGWLPKHAICLNYRTKRLWLEEYPFYVGYGVVWPAGADVSQCLLGTESKKVWSLAKFDVTLDGPNPASGTVRGTVTSSTIDSISDSAASFASSGLVLSPVHIYAGTGRGQVRNIASVSGAKITVTQPWLVLPDTTSEYQVGGVKWTYQTGWMRYIDSEGNATRRLEVVYEPTSEAADLDVRFLHDFETPLITGITYASSDLNGVGLTQDSTYNTIDMTKDTGINQITLQGKREIYTDGLRFVSVELSGVSNEDEVKVYSIEMDGVE